MKKNAVGVIILILASGLIFFYGWPKLKPYLSSPPPPPPGAAQQSF